MPPVVRGMRARDQPIYHERSDLGKIQSAGASCAVRFEFRQASDCLRSERGGIARDLGLSSPIDVRYTTVERRDEFAKLVRKFSLGDAHQYLLRGARSRRDLFHNSPQLSQRQ